MELNVELKILESIFAEEFLTLRVASIDTTVRISAAVVQ